MFLLPLAERHRRSLFLTILLLVLLVQSWLQWGPLQQLARAVLAPIAAITMPLAGQVVDRVDPRAAPPGVLGEQASFDLIRAERAQGQPPPVPGVAWLEIPVYQVQRAEHRLLLAAGSEYGLAVDMPVVFGSTWLGRLSKVTAFSAEVELCSAAGVPTAVSLPIGNGQPPLRAVVEGRGSKGPPLLRWIETRAEPREGGTVHRRFTSAQDLPGLAGMTWELGAAHLGGDLERGSEFWEVSFFLPAGAEGRVFIPAGAVSQSTVAEPKISRSPARLALRVDGVLGADLCGLRCLDPVVPSIVLSDRQVLGKVIAQRGDLLWCYLKPATLWGLEALRLSDVGSADRTPVQLFTRGTATIPRGLPLGSETAAAPVPGRSFQAVTRVPLASSPEEKASQ